MKKDLEKRNSERGGAGVKLLAVAVVLFLIGNAGYQWIPAAYAGENLKQEMQAAVLQGLTLPPSAGNPAEATRKRLEKFAAANSIPPEAFIEVKMMKSSIQAHVSYTKQIPLVPFGIYNYEYQFNHIATPTGFLTQQD